MKKIGSIALAALLVLGSVAALASCSALVDDDDVLEDYMAEVLTYTTKGNGTLIFEETPGGTAMVVGYTGKALENDVVDIPYQIEDSDGDELLVNKIGKEAFYNLSSISEVQIPATVTCIDEYAFAGCTSLVSVVIVPVPVETEDEEETGVTEIAKQVSEVETDETSVESEDADKVDDAIVVSTIENYAFQACESLVSIEWMDNLISIGDYAFYGCRSLAELNFPDSLESIGQSAFWNCRSLTVLDTNNVKAIGIFAFYNCMGLDTIYLRDSLEQIGAFDGKDDDEGNDNDILRSESVFVIKLDGEEAETGADIEDNYLATLATSVVWDWDYNPKSVARQYYEVRILGGIVVEDDEDEAEVESDSEGDIEETTEAEDTTTEAEETTGESEVEEPIWN